MNKIIHEGSRLKILTYLAGSGDRETSFTDLQKELAMSSGNLSIQLKKLSDSSYVKINKTFRDNKPFTSVALTRKGHLALEEYLDEMESIIKSLRGRKK